MQQIDSNECANQIDRRLCLKDRQLYGVHCTLYRENSVNGVYMVSLRNYNKNYFDGVECKEWDSFSLEDSCLFLQRRIIYINVNLSVNSFCPCFLLSHCISKHPFSLFFIDVLHSTRDYVRCVYRWYSSLFPDYS